jgi:hypothetical protein
MRRCKTRMPLHQRRDVTVFCATNKIASPMTGDGAVLDFCRSFLDGDSIYDLTARVFKDTSVLRPAYAALGSQVPNQLFLQHSAGLNEQAAVNRFVGHAHALVGLPKARPIMCSDCPAFQRLHSSVRCAAESATRFPWVIHTTFEQKFYSRWCCIDPLRPPDKSGLVLRTGSRLARQAQSGI